MNVRSTSLRAVLALATIASTSAWAAGPQKAQIPGYLDARTGQFVAKPQVAAQTDLDPLAVGTYGGTLSLRINITLKSSVPADWPIHCTQSATVLDMTGTTVVNQKTVKATRSGSTATCTVNINYAWLINNTNAQVHTTYSVLTLGDSSVLENIDVYGTLAPIAVPANGQTTSRTVAVTL
ncbi:hypothetical protein [Ideonella sp.]|uniref:hypothetical protein n=1 Tax=Ideonella sp. TaxID=1929293 RepID=UPI0035AE038E